MIRPSSPLTMLLSRHTRRREFITLLGGGVAARKHGHTSASGPDSVQSEFRYVPWIGLELTSLDALDDVSKHIVGAAC